MRNWFAILRWELWRHIRLRSFWLATILPPLVLATLALAYLIFYEQSHGEETRVIGCLELDSTQYCQQLRQRLDRLKYTFSDYPQVELVEIHADTSAQMKRMFEKTKRLKYELDSLEEAYNRIRQRRQYLFQQPDSPTKRRLMRQAYEQLLMTREQRDLAQLDYQRQKASTDSLWQNEVLRTADSLLFTKAVDGYIILRAKDFQQGKVEYHSQIPSQFLQIEPIRQVLQEYLVEMRLQAEGITATQIHELLKPVQINEILVEGIHKRQFSFFQTYMVPILLVVFLFISIFTPSGFLFYGLIAEKRQHVLEMILSSAHTLSIFLGKIVALGLLGFVQIIIWLLTGLGLIHLGIITPESIGFNDANILKIFLWYFLLGYLFFGSVSFALGTFFSQEEDAHYWNTILRFLSISPVLFGVPLLMFPNSIIIRILSYIPILSPTIMVLRTPFGHPPQLDYWISSIVLGISIIISLILAYRLFRNVLTNADRKWQNIREALTS